MTSKNLQVNLRIALDLDDTIFDFIGAFNKKFPKANWNKPSEITKLVHKLRLDKQFWENLPLLERPNFEPHIYSTKRINSKIYTRNCLIRHNIPIKPIYQMLYQHGNKADQIKGRCDVLIDDSISNVKAAIKSGLPALVIDRPHNRADKSVPRIYALDLDQIYEQYLNLKQWMLKTSNSNLF